MGDDFGSSPRLSQWVTTLLNFLASHLGMEVSAEADASQTPDGMPTPVAAQPTGGAIYIQPELNKEQTLHPAGISRRWSLLYVWLQVCDRARAPCRGHARDAITPAMR